MAEQKMKYIIEVDAQTGAVSGFADAMSKTKTETEKTGDAFDKMGKLVGNIAIKAFFLNAIKGALDSTEAFQQLKAQVDDTMKAFVNVAGPVLDFISQKLSMSLTTLRGVFSSVKALLKGDLDGALTLLGDAIQAGSELGRQGVKVMTDETRKKLQIGYQEQIDDLRQHYEMHKATTIEGKNERMKDLEDEITAEAEILQEQRSKGIINEEQYLEGIKELKKRKGTEAVAIVKDEMDKEAAIRKKSIDNYLQVVNAGMTAVNNSIYKAAESGKMNAREMAKDLLGSIGKAMAGIVQSSAIAAAGVQMAAGNWGGAAATLAWGEVQAAAISALTGAAVGAIGGGTPSNKEPGSAPESPSYTAPGVGGSSGPGMSAASGPGMVINIQTLDGNISPEALHKLTEAIKRKAGN